MNRKNTPEDFYARVDKNGPNGCWSWLGPTNKLGYGQLGYQGRRLTAHRLSYELNKGEIPEGQIVRHTCDNPNCCNPEHLLIGTHQDNMDDKRARGRQRGPAGTPSLNPVFPTLEERNLAQYGACQDGHILTPNNIYTKKSGERVCSTCFYFNKYIHRSKFNREPLSEQEDAVVLNVAAAIEAAIATLPELVRERTLIAIGKALEDLTTLEANKDI